MRRRHYLTVGLACLALTSGALADPSPQLADNHSDFEGVWAPEPMAPQRPGRPFPPDRPVPHSGPMEMSQEDQAKGLDHGDMRTRDLMTDAGKAKFATYDPLLNPASNCQTPGLPSIAHIPELQEWTLDDDTLTIRHESWQTVRTAYLVPTASPEGPHTVLGHATARFEGTTLIIDTTHLNAQWAGLGRNAPGSDQRTVRETYRMIDHDTIRGVVEITDPLYLKRPMIMPITLRRQPKGTQIVDFPCDVEVSQRDCFYIRAGVEK